MVGNMFAAIVNISITASIVAGLVILFRCILGNKLPKFFSYAMWFIVLIRLLVPFSLPSKVSLFNIIPMPNAIMTQSIQYNETYNKIPYNTNIMVTTQPNMAEVRLNNDLASTSYVSAPKSSVDLHQIFMSIISWLWVVTMSGLFLLSMLLYFRTFKNLNEAVLYHNDALVSECCQKLNFNTKIRVYVSDRVQTPVVCGLFNVRIILPLALTQCCSKSELSHIIMHELVHIKRFDYIVKPLWILALCIHWFNPVIWFSFILSQKDMEVSCDERVMLVCDNDIRNEYATSLIKVAVDQNMMLNAGLLAFGESNIKGRVRGIMKFKKPTFWIGVIGVIAVVIVAVMLLTNGQYELVGKERGYVDGGNVSISFNLLEKGTLNDLIKHRSKYIGDASNVGSLLGKLPFGNYRKEMSLSTEKEPYGITVNYDFNSLDISKVTIESVLQNNALIMFALIENVEDITFKIPATIGEQEYAYSRNEMQKHFNDNLWGYSKNIKTFKLFVQNICFKLNVFPDTYTLAMSSTPGICILAEYNDAVEKVRYSAENGVLFTWNFSTGEVSKGVNTMDIPYGSAVYWLPINGEVYEDKNDVVTVALFDKNGGKINEKCVNIKYDGSAYYRVEPSIDVVLGLQVQKPKNIEDAVSVSIKNQGSGYIAGECVTEGHTIFETKQKDGIVKAYTIASVGIFGFENGVFTKIGGTGAIPTVMKFSVNEDGEYCLIDYEEAMDGALYSESIRRMFPVHLHDRLLSLQDDYSHLVKQEEAQAEEYLQSIGRTAKVDAGYVEKNLVRINVDASNKLFAELSKDDMFLNNCPYWIGTKERIEGGIRYIYETSQSKTTAGHDVVVFKKTKEDGTVIEQRKYKIVGSEPQLIN